MSSYADTENLKLSKKISTLVEKQLPGFIKEEGEDFSLFLKKYYEWMETHELIISNPIQNENKFSLETSSGFLIQEDKDKSSFLLESDRDSKSGFIKNEKIVGQSSGAIGFVDRNTKITDFVLFPSGGTKKDFIPGEKILAEQSRISATVKSYYKNPLFASRTLIKNRDIDLSTSFWIDNFSNQFLSDVPDNIRGDKALIIKHITDVYRAKGSQASYDFLFKTLYDIQDLEYYSPKDDLWKASDGNWVSDKTLRIQTFDTVDKFEGRTITGRTSFATGQVDRVETFASGALQITELYLKDVQGTFVIGENIDSTLIDGTFGTGIAQGVITNVNVENPGTGYKIGDPVTFTGGGGVEASAIVKSIATGTISTVQIFDGGDGYVSGLEMKVNNFGTRGTGLESTVIDVEETFSFPTNDDKLINHYYKLLNQEAFGMGGNPTNNIQHTLIETLGFSTVDAGVITGTNVKTVGVNYEELPKVTVRMDNVAELNMVGTDILNLNPDPDDFGRTNAITGTFRSGERITANNGEKIGTFFSTVSDSANTKTIEDPTQMRVKPVEYLGVYGVGVNDFIPKIDNYVQSNSTIYDVKITTGGKFIKNKFKFRRGLSSLNSLITYDDSTDPSQYTSTETEITGNNQTLQFSVTSLERSGDVATVTAYGRHGFKDGEKVIISGADQTEYNGEKTISVNQTDLDKFTFTVSGSPTTPATGTIVYDENVAVRFMIPYKHVDGTDFPNTPDRFLFSAKNFENADVITGFTSGAQATVNVSESAVYSAGGFAGNNAVIGAREDDVSAGSIGELLLTNPGVGFTSRPALSMTSFGSGDAILTANIGTIGQTYGRYFDENGFISYSKKIIDSNFYQDFSYSLRTEKQLNEYEQIVKKLLHPVGTKLFGEFKPRNDELNFSFDNSVLMEDGSFIEIEGSFDKILTETYFEPTHNVDLKTIKSAPNSTGLTLTGGSNLLVDKTGTADLKTDYVANSFVVIDEEQAFTVSYGEMKLQNFKKGTVSTDSQNNITRFIIQNTTSNFTTSSVVTQTKSTEETVQGIVLRHETNALGNNVLILHTCNGIFNSTKNLDSGTITANLYSSDSNVIFGGTQTIKLGKITGLSRDSSTRTLGTVTLDDFHHLIHKDKVTISGINNALWNGTYLVEVANSTAFTFKGNAVLPLDESVTFSDATVTLNRGTDFENEFSVNDFIILNSSSEKTKILNIVNSSCIIANTRISTDSDFNFIKEDGGKLLSEDGSGDNLILNLRDPKKSSIDNLSDESFLILEQTVRGNTTANGLKSGLLLLGAEDSDFEKDLIVGDVIALSSNINHEATVTKITPKSVFRTQNSDRIVLEDGSLYLTESSVTLQRLDLTAALGDGTNQTIVLKTSRNLDLEPVANSITLSGNYDGSNNFLRISERSGRFTTTGLLLLEDGIGLTNAQYVGTVSLEGSFKFESNSVFNNQSVKLYNN